MADTDDRDPIAGAAAETATRHRLTGLIGRSVPLTAWSHLTATKAWLTQARAAAGAAGQDAGAAAEWLLDNDYQIQRAILQIEEDLPAKFYRKLPGLSGDGQGRPRIHELAHSLLQASHLQVSMGTAVVFVSQYQQQMPLSIAEIWAFPTMLRIACLELLIAGFSRLFPDTEPPFPVEAAPHAAAAAVDETECVARAIANLAVISTIQWNDFFDQTSHVEAILRRDPAGVYPHMDFETRDNYRHAIEQLADHARQPEWEVAERALRQCHSSGDAPSGHVGYWLIDEGRPYFEDALDSRVLGLESLGRRILRYPGQLYAIALFIAGLAAFILPALYLAWTETQIGYWLLGIALSILPATVLSITVVNWLVTQIVPPRVLPKMDFRDGIPADCATAVVMPVLVARLPDIDPLLRRLEAHRLANPDPALHFVLLSDHADAPTETLPTDAAIERALVSGIEALNARHAGRGHGPFHLMHRPRLYNEAQGCWMGWERKRGKLEQFNAFILRGDLAPFSLTTGRTERLRKTRFVVTADADTRLPTGVVTRMVGTLAHPLNHAQFDPGSGGVERGYTILQPRVELAPESTGESRFAHIYGGDTTIDIYSRAVSDVYQDLLGTGVFVGKGIYDVAGFARSLENRIPENSLLSHDLFEGLHGRAALASDIIVYEGFPSGYLDYVWRWHRWVRGDWQLLFWLFPFVPGRGGRWLPNRLGWFDRLKIFDNLRRSLVPASIVALLLGGWFLLHGNPLVWTLLAIAAPAANLFTDLVTGFARGRRRGVMQRVLRRLSAQAARWILALAFIVSDAVIALHAIGVTLWRLRSRRRLLEWTSAVHMARRNASRHPRLAAWRDMAPSPLLALAIAGGLLIKAPAALPVAAPLLLLWLLAPEIAIAISRPVQPPAEELTSADRKFLRLIARRAWLFFETFVRPEDNWLPPDNYQEPPDEETAHRTSPTNIGMMMLSVLTAWRLGHISLHEVEMRLRNALDTMDRLERYRGHILNWYDTTTLASLEPRYVSTVDSGNLAVSLIVVDQALREADGMASIGIEQWAGLEDLIDLLAQALSSMEGAAGEAVAPAAAILAAMRDAATGISPDGADWTGRIDELIDKDMGKLRDQIGLMAAEAPESDTATLREIQSWLERIDHHLLGMRRDIALFMPWMPLLAASPPGCGDVAAELSALLGIPRDAQADSDGRARAILALDAFIEGRPPDMARVWAEDVRGAIREGEEAAGQLNQGLASVARRAGALAHGMDFALLFDGSTCLFHIGYNVSADRIDPHHYDLLASEARLASFFAIAKGDIPPSHWFHLGRPITKGAAGLALVSWNGSMFEYLMPNIFLHSDPATLLGQSDRTAIDIQARFGKERDIPWGISESSFATMGQDRIYHYHAFGVPELGLRRGLGRDLVIAPYATALALTTRPGLATRNLRDLAALGLVGRFGFYEAADFTPERVPQGKPFTTVKSYMAHHHGMSLAALGNALCDDMLVRWFHADAYVQTVDLLLNERIPWELPPEIARVEFRDAQAGAQAAVPGLFGWTPEQRQGAPAWHVLGNGRLSTRIRTDGAGGLTWHQHALTRIDAADHEAGYWLYLRDRDDGRIWSATGGPFPPDAGMRQSVFHADQAEFHHRVHGISATTTVSIAHGDDLEIRRVALVNEDAHPRTIDITSYAEVVLAPPLDAARHPAFSKMFVGAEALPGHDGLIFTRRPRSPSERSPILLHRVIGDDEGMTLHGVEGDRRAFLGRHGAAADPAMMRQEALSGSQGWTLDPIFALRAQITLPPHGRREIAFLTIAAGSRQSALDIAERYATLPALDWAMSDAAAAAAREMHAIGLAPAQVPQAQELLSALLAARATPRAGGAHPYGRGDIWALGISGDNPILVVRTGDGERTTILRFLLCAHALWRQRGLPVDLVITHEGTSGYIEPVRERILTVLRETGTQDRLGINGGIHLVGIGPSDADRAALLDRIARLILDENDGDLREQLFRSEPPPVHTPRFAPVEFDSVGSDPAAGAAPAPSPTPLPRPEGLAFDNGRGGFAPDDGSYVIHLEPGETTPAPWSNVLANEAFGTIVTEAGLGFSWAVNSGENRLTPWFNDPVRDPQGERLYLRDEDNARLWTPTPLPAGGDSACRIQHGIGHTLWQRQGDGLEQELLAFVPATDDPVKLVRLRLRNLTSRARRITATYYAEWMLGAVHGEQAPLRTSVYEPAIHAILATNPWTDEFRDQVGFLTSTLPPHSLTTSCRDFHGITADPARPEGLLNWDLGNRPRAAGDDCCAAIQVHLDVPAGGTAEAVFILGQGKNTEDAKALARRWQDAALVEQALQDCRTGWETRLGATVVNTPDPAFDLMVNRWLPYQSTSARVRARAGFYQAGGAFGFRDQLQDVLALLFADPAAVRRHILIAAAHQFEEGDVLHWWHPPSDRGVRTRCSDDLLWLPYATASYVEATGDTGILTEEVPFLSAPPLGPEEHDRYARFDGTDYTQPLFVHCERALDHAYQLGAHGLPLIGTGDWNDGMDRVGSRGRGESIWLAWFYITTIKGFVGLCARQGQPHEVMERWKARADGLAAAVERSGWDGDWYLRAFDDEGRAWGTAQEQECRIDSIAQSWSILSSAGDPDRTRRALASARHHLVRGDDRLVRLLDPPFDRTPREPGYIKAYPPGIRENGGQYTHAAAWLAIACARSGDGDGAKALFDRINPICHAATPQDAALYRTEPYVVAADISGVAPHLGQGGWTWYTGAAAWTWRLAVEEILGLRLADGKLRLSPCLPKDWPMVEAMVRQPTGSLRIVIRNDHGLGSGPFMIRVNGEIRDDDDGIAFPDDGSTHEVEAHIGKG
ncbi:MAG: glucoamylase family protein [Sphingobium sp.]